MSNPEGTETMSEGDPRTFTGNMKRYSILRFFEYAHLPERLQRVSAPFAEMAMQMATGFGDFEQTTDAETAAGLRRLLEAKDCAVRAALLRAPQP